MDLDYHGREDLGEHLIRAYVGESGDHDILEVLSFYKCYRAYVRGKVESFRLDDPRMPGKEKEEAKSRASRYFDLSYRYAQEF
jgi:aminoglycoside phosphotransferase family enzyme